MSLGSKVEFSGTDRYRVEESLGSGSMGTVFKAFDREDKTYVAVKVLDTMTPEALGRFKREFRALQDLQHPNLIVIGEMAEVDGLWFYSMEMIEGVDFLSYVRGDHGRLRAGIVQLARGLATLHRARLVHRDVKPSNILVTDEGRVVLLDFGLVLDSNSPDRISEDRVVGTGAYLAPEQVRPDATGPASDCYAMGTLMYEALTGELPFPGALVESLMRKQHDTPRSPRTINPTVPADLDRLCVELLSSDPSARPSAEDVQLRLGDSVSGSHGFPMPRKAPFVGRRRELARLMAGIEQRRPTVIVLSGESGMGKTALIRQFEQETKREHADAVMLSGRCYERESVPFKGVDGAVESLSRHMRQLDMDEVMEVMPDAAALLTHAFPSLRRVAGFRELSQVRMDVIDPLESRRQVFLALRQMLNRMASLAPLVLEIDDMHWAGRDSWDVLEHVMQPPDAPNLLLILTTRTTNDPDARRERLRDQFPGGFEIMELGTLQADEARELARGLLTQLGSVAIDAADAVAREAEGHPLFIAQLVRYMVESGAASPGVARLEDALRARFARLSDGARNVLQLVAAAGLPHPQALIAAAGGSDFTEFSRYVTELRIAHMVRSSGSRGNDTIEHYHDRIRHAALAELSESELATIHTRIADTLEDTGLAEREPELAVHHLIAAGATERAGYYAAGAAERAMKALAFDRASALYRVAIDNGDYHDSERRRLRLELAEALIADGRGADAAAIYLSEADGGDTADRLDCKRQAAEQLLTSGHLSRGVQVLDEVLAEIGESLPKNPKKALTSLVWQRFMIRLRGLKWKPRDASEIARRDLVRLDVYKSVSTGLSMVNNITGAAFQARHLRLALKIGERERAVRAISIEGVFLASQVSKKRAREIARLVKEWASQTSDPATRAYALFTDVAVAFFMDNAWEDGLAAMEKSEKIMRNHYQAAGWEHDTVRMYRCFCLLHLGRIHELSGLARSYIRDCERRGDLYGSVNLRARLILPWLAADDVAGAAQSLDKALNDWQPWTTGFLVQHFFALHSLVELALYRGEPDEAARVVDEQYAALKSSFLLRVPMVKAEMDFARARVAVMQAQLGGAVDRADHLDRAKSLANQLSKAPVPSPHGWAKLIVAGVMHVSGATLLAANVLRTAVEELDKGDNHLYANCGRLLLGEILGATDSDGVGQRAAGYFAKQGVSNPPRFVASLTGWTSD